LRILLSLSVQYANIANGRQGNPSKTRKGDTPSGARKSAAKAHASTAPDQQSLQATSRVKCVKCNNIIGDDTRALNCEKCCKTWKCSSCVGIRTSTYDDLVSDAGNELHWYCEPCFASVVNPLCDDKVTEVLSKLSEQLARTEVQLNAKADATHMESVELAIKRLESKVCDNLDTFTQVIEKSGTDNAKTEAANVEAIEAIKKLENKVCDNFDTFAQVVEKSRTDNAKTDAANVEAIEVMVKELENKTREQKQEEEDKERRKCSVIIHGRQ